MTTKWAQAKLVLVPVVTLQATAMGTHSPVVIVAKKPATFRAKLATDSVSNFLTF